MREAGAGANETIYRDASGRIINVAMKRAEARRAAEAEEALKRREEEEAKGDVQRAEKATRMQVLNIPDVSREMAVDAIKRFRYQFKHEEVAAPILNEVYTKVGGRLRFLNQVARALNVQAKGGPVQVTRGDALQVIEATKVELGRVRDQLNGQAGR